MPVLLVEPSALVLLFSRRMMVPAGETRSIAILFREPWATLTTALRLLTTKFGSVMLTFSGNEVVAPWAITPLSGVNVLEMKSAATAPSRTRLAWIRSTGGVAPGWRPEPESSQITETWPPGTTAPPATAGSAGRPWLITIWGAESRAGPKLPEPLPLPLAIAGGANVLPPSAEPVSSMTLGFGVPGTLAVLLLVPQAT